MYDDGNIFSKIIKKQIDVSIIFENESILAFHDIKPKAKIHVIIIPKQSVINYEDFIKQNKHKPAKITEFFENINHIAINVLKLNSFQIITNNNK